jgi:hypothetical protein
MHMGKRAPPLNKIHIFYMNVMSAVMHVTSTPLPAAAMHEY